MARIQRTVRFFLLGARDTGETTLERTLLNGSVVQRKKTIPSPPLPPSLCTDNKIREFPLAEFVVCVVNIIPGVPIYLLFFFFFL